MSTDMTTNMSTDMTTLRRRLRDVDPAADTAAYPTVRQDEVIARVLADDRLHVAGDPRATSETPFPARRGGPGVWHPRRPVWTAAAAVLALASVAVGGVVLQPESAVAVSAEMNRLAGSAAGPLPSNRYLYTETRTVYVGGSTQPGAASDRRWDTETNRAWQGDSCNDRLDTTLAPARFFSTKDEENFRAQASPEDLRTAREGWTVSARGRELWALDDVPCSRPGTFLHPNPAYAATYPSDPAAFLAKVTRDASPKEGESYETPADAVLKMLALPYLTGPQRSAALRAFGAAAGDWTVSGHTTVAGVPGVVIRRDLGPVEEERVIGDRAPGLLRSVLRITDADHAGEFDPRYAGLADGTVVLSQELLKVGVVPDLETTP
jgi:hypothetical protein